tara:strand:- start:1932 stop:2627 length:696 start_codon:yes stop_codon:yes gene_type:complete
MEVSPSKFGLAISLVVGISGIFLITRAKTGNTVTRLSSNIHTRSSNIGEDFEADIIGDYVAHGHAGSVFRLPSGDVLKIVSLENDMLRGDGEPNRDQAEFIENLWLKKLDGENSFSPEFAEIKHYHRGYAGPKMTELVNGESPAYEKRPLKVGEKIAYWVMEYIPTIGDMEMDEDYRQESMQKLRNWAKTHGYELDDLTQGNYGQRADGSFVAFDPWPTKISKEVNDSLDR